MDASAVSIMLFTTLDSESLIVTDPLPQFPPVTLFSCHMILIVIHRMSLGVLLGFYCVYYCTQISNL